MFTALQLCIITLCEVKEEQKEGSNEYFFLSADVMN